MELLAWALATGGITGAVWVAIVLLGRERRRSSEQARLVGELERRVKDLEQVDRRLLDAEERLDFTERAMQHERRQPPQ